MNFIQRLKDENKTEDLINAFKVEYNDNLIYEIDYWHSSKSASLRIYTCAESGVCVAMYVISNYDLKSLPNGRHVEGYEYISDAKSRKIYLKFMKKTFKEYENKYIEDVDYKALQKKIEIIEI